MTNLNSGKSRTVCVTVNGPSE